jgi:AmmeMemoRadiSam system protein A
LDPASRHALLVLVRSAVEVAVGVTEKLQAVEAGVLHERRGAFVTLRKGGALRGCIGRVEPNAPLLVMLPEVARQAALDDPRFPPVDAGELPQIRIEVSLLTTPAPVAGPGDIVVGRDGLIVASRARRGLLLPQVAVEYGWSVEEFLSHTCHKAGLPPQAWRDGAVRVLSFQADVCGEQEVE